ncbi:MAG: hypothetical protein ABI675_25780 [Chitinophagaceae bacterium]
MRVSEIILELSDVDQLLIGPDSLFYGKRMLSPDAEEVIIEEAKITTAKEYIHLKIHLHKDEISRQQEITSAIHQHFSYRKKKSARQLKKVLQLGWRSLGISIVFLSFLVSLTLVIIKLLPEGSLSTTFREILIILGWVALWRPADILLYDWRPFKREVNLFGRLERCKVEIIVGKV